MDIFASMNRGFDFGGTSGEAGGHSSSRLMTDEPQERGICRNLRDPAVCTRDAGSVWARGKPSRPAARSDDHFARE